MASGSTNSKKTVTKQPVPQSVIDKWLQNNPSVDPSGFTFSKLKDLKISGTTTLNKSVKAQVNNASFKADLKNKLNNHPSGFTYNLSSSTKSVSIESLFSGNTSFVNGKVNFVKSSGNTESRWVKPASISGNTNTRQSLRSSINAGLSLQEPSLVFTAGTVDKSFPFGPTYGFESDIYDIKVQADGKILVAGDTSQYYNYGGNSYDMQGLIRLNSDGTVDDGFDIIKNSYCYGGGFDNSVLTIAIQPDGKILLGGYFTSFDRDNNCNTANRIIRLNSDGSRDLTFNTGDAFDSNVYSIVVQPDGKILVGGRFVTYNGNDAYYIIRLNSNGSIDSSFHIGNDSVSFDNYVNIIKLQSDGKIICGGNFTVYSGVSQNYITRLNSNGTLDTTFQIGNGFNNVVYAIGLQSDGKIIVGGDFIYFDNNDLVYGNIVRLNINGTLDTYFGYGLDNPVYSITIQSNDKILVGGDFVTYYTDFEFTLNIDELVRFNADCSFDSSFYYEELFNASVNAIAVLEDGKILVGGAFDNGGDPTVYPLNYFGRLNNSITTYPYVYLGWTNFCNNIFPETTMITVGSMTPPILTLPYFSGSVYSFSVLSHPSQTKIGIAIPGSSEFFGYPTNNIELVQVNDYGSFENSGCYDAIYDNSMVAFCADVFDAIPSLFSILVDKKYKLGDIGFYNFLWDDEGGANYRHSTFEIIDIHAYDGDGVLPSEILPYMTYESAEDSVRANGQYIYVGDCYAPCGSWALSKQYDICLTGGTISYYNCTNCGEIYGSLSYFNNSSESYEVISAGTSTINSTQVWENAVECAANNTPYGGQNYDFKNYGFNGNVIKIAEQSNGQILVGGSFTEYSAFTVNYLTRLDTDGKIDESFNQYYSPGPVWSTDTPFTGTGVGGSILFDGHSLVSADTTNGVWDLANNDFTFEWFQYFTGDINNKPTVFDYNSGYITTYFSYNSINIFVHDTIYTFSLNSSIEQEWHHFAITRNFIDPDYVWRIFQNGIEIGTFNYGINFGPASPLIIGDAQYTADGNGKYTGNITNFRVNNICALYTENFDVPTEPLDPNYPSGGCNTIICLLASNETDYIMDSCDDEIPTTITSGYYLGAGFNGTVYAITLQSDGKILVGGDFTTYNGEFAGHIIRLNTDGSIDNSFTYSSEFNGTVYAIAIQNDGKIVAGGSFSYYYDYECPGYVRLNSDGTPDTTFTLYPFEGEVYSILLEDVNDIQYYSGQKITNQNIIIGGWFGMYIPELDIQPNALAKFKSDGTFINVYGGGFTDYDYGVYDMKKQSDGKLICVGSFWEYQFDYCPSNIIRINTDGTQDLNFIGLISDDFGGFTNGYVNSLEILPNDKIMVGGNGTSFGDMVDYYHGLPYLVRLKSNGTLDTTFTYQEDDDYVLSILLKSDKTLLVGGAFSYSNASHLLELFIGEDFQLRAFNTCDGKTKNIYLPSTATTTDSTVTISDFNLSLMYFNEDNYPVDDDYIVCDLPAGYSIDFLNSTYTSINVSSNSFITFGNPTANGGAGSCCFNIPDQIDSDGPGQPGVYLSTACSANDLNNGLDNEAFFVYSGLTNDGNAMIIRYLGGYHCDYNYPTGVELIYNFIIYKGISNYFDLQIDNNTIFYNDDPTGGTSDGSNAFIGTFNSSSNKSYRINSDGSIGSLANPIKADINTSNVVCGTIGDVITTPQVTVGTSKACGSMYFDGTDNTTVTVDYNVNMDLDYTSWTIEWFQYFTSNDSCCLRVFDIGSFPAEEVGVSIENNQLAIWLKSGSTFVNLMSPIKDTWTHFAITAQDMGGNERIIRVFQNGVLLDSFSFYDDLNNFQGDPQVNLPLTIGGMGNGTATFNGYITNFRWTKGTCYYFDDFTVPTSPLQTEDSQMLLLALNSGDLLYDSTETQTITASGVTWSQLNPFGFPEYFISTDTTPYDDCASCTATTVYNATLLVRDGIKTPYIYRVVMSLESINNITAYGPIFTESMGGIHGLNVYELLGYSL